MTLYVVYVQDTGHVVGAVNTTGAAPPADVASLVGDALPLRVSLGAGEIAILPLSARELAIHTPDDESGVFADPLAFGVEQVEDADPKPALVRLQALDTPPSFAGPGLVVKVPVDMSQDTPVLVLVSEGQDTLVRPGTIVAGTREVTLPVTVSAGPHGVLALVAGFAGYLEAVTT